MSWISGDIRIDAINLVQCMEETKIEIGLGSRVVEKIEQGESGYFG
ncbi:MAG: hypothetical protein EZS28_050211, partial [Streblomastix strix]